MAMDKLTRRSRRKRSIRKRISGSPAKPRMCVHKSNRNINVQIIDDIEGKTLCSVSTLSDVLKSKLKSSCRKKVECGTALGEEVAKAASSKGIRKVVFDRGGYRYHGVVKAIAEAARKNGLEF